MIFFCKEYKDCVSWLKKRAGGQFLAYNVGVSKVLRLEFFAQVNETGEKSWQKPSALSCFQQQ